jgi:hypothetical protein
MEHPRGYVLSKETDRDVFIDPEKVVRPDEGFIHFGGVGRIVKRNLGNFKGIGLHLPDTLRWRIVTDSEGAAVLMATRRGG